MSIAIRPVRPAGRWERVYRAAMMVAAAQVLWVFVMGLIAGGQFVADQWPDWDPLVPWPVLAIPPWVPIALSAVAAVAAVAMSAARSVTNEVGLAFQDLAVGTLVLAIIPVGLARIYPDPNGVPVPLYGADATFGWHWIAAVVHLVGVVALIVRLVRARRASGRPA